MLKIKKKITTLVILFATFLLTIGFAVLGLNSTTDVVKATTETADIYMKESASVRVDDPIGIRFSTYVSEEYAESGRSFGTLIIPKTAYSGDIADINENTPNVLDIPQVVWTESDVIGYKKYTAVLIGIPESFYGVDIYAMSYANNGGVYEFVDNPQSYSIAYIASAALNNGETGETLWTYTKAVATGISLDATEATLFDNETLALNATTQPEGYKAVWQSSNESVATVDKNGVVTGVSHGTATITATFGNYSASCAVTVWPYSVGFEGGIPADFITAKAGATTYALSNAQAKDGDYSLRIKGNSAGYGNVTFNVEYLDKVFADPHVLGLEMDVYSTATFTDFCYRGLNTNGIAADIAYDSEGLTAGEWKTIIYPRSAYENLSALGSSKYQLYFSSGVAFELYVDNMCPISGYIVSYDANAGSVGNATTTLMVGDSYTLETPTAPDAFANFDGWYLDGEEFPMAGTWALEEDITLTAKWTYAQSFENGIPTGFTGTLRNTTVSQSNAQASDGSYSMLLHTTSSNGYGYTCISKDYLDKVFADPNVIALAIDVYSNATFTDFAYRGFRGTSENNLPYAGKAGLTADTWMTVYYGRKAYEDSASLTGTNYLFYYSPNAAGLDLYIDNIRPVTADELGINFAEGGEASGEIYSLNGETLLTISGGVSNLTIYDGESTDGDGKSIRYKFWRRTVGSDIILPMDQMLLGAGAYSYIAFDVKTAYDVNGALYYTNNTGTGTYKDIKAGEWTTLYCPINYYNLTLMDRTYIFRMPACADYDDFFVCVDNIRFVDEKPAEYTITYDANGGSVGNATTTLMVGDTYALETPTAPDAFANFVGWYLDGEEFPMTGTWTIEEDITLTAKWTYAQSFENGIPTGFTGTLRNTTVSQSNAQASDGSYSMLLHTTSSNGYGYTCISKDYLDKVFADPNVIALAIDVYSNATFTDFAYRGFRGTSENNLPYAGKAGLTADTWMTVYYGRKAYEDSASLTGTNYLFYYSPNAAGLDLYIDNIRPVTADELGINFAEGGEASGEIYSLNDETILTVSGGVTNLMVYEGESTDGDGKSIRYQFWRGNPGSDIILPMDQMLLGAGAYSYVAFDVKTAYDVSGALYYTNNSGTGTYKDIKAGEWTTLYCPINYYDLTLMDRTYIFRLPAYKLDNFLVYVDNIRFVNEKPTEYTITYDANGGSVGNATTTLMVGDSYTLETPTAANFLVFEGWYLDGEQSPMTGTWTLEEDITLTAKWNNYQSFENGVPSDLIASKAGATIYVQSNVQASEGEYAMKLTGNSSGYGYIAFSEAYLDSIFADPNVTGLAIDVYSTTTFTDFRYRGFNASGTEANVYYDGIGVEYDSTGLTAGEWKTLIFPRRAYEARDSLTGTVHDIYFVGGAGMELYVDNMRAIAQMQYMDLGDAYVADNAGVTIFNVGADVMRVQIDYQSVALEASDGFLVIPNSALTVGEHSLVMSLPNNVELRATLMVYSVTEATAEMTLTYGSQGYQTLNYANVTRILSNGIDIPFEYNSGNSSVLIADATILELLPTENGSKVLGTVELVILTTGENYLLSLEITLSGSATVLSGATYENNYAFSSAGYSSVEYFTSKNMTHLSPEKLMEYKNSGLTVVHPCYDASVSATATELTVQTKTLLANAAEVGLKVILEDYFLVNLSESTTGSLIGTTYADTEALDAAVWERLQIYCDYEAFYGVVLADEPYYEVFTAYGEVYQSIKRVCETNNVECYIHCNMLSGFAGYEALGASSDFASNSTRFNAYKAYLQKFLNVTGADYIMYDLYPLTSSGLTGWGLFTLQAAAEVAKENDVALNVVTQTCTIQSSFFGTDNERIMSIEDLHWMNNMLLGFGVKEIHYFTYYARPENENETFIDAGSFVTSEGEKTDVYYRMQAILAQNQQFASVIKSFDYVSSNLIKGVSVTYNNTGITNTTDSTREYARAEEFDTDSFSGALTAVSADKEYVLLTKLNDGTNDMYMVQNVVDPQYDVLQTVTMTFTGKTYAVVYENGFKRIVKLNGGGTLTLKLSEGNAAYVMTF